MIPTTSAIKSNYENIVNYEHSTLSNKFVIVQQITSFAHSDKIDISMIGIFDTKVQALNFMRTHMLKLYNVVSTEYISRSVVDDEIIFNDFVTDLRRLRTTKLQILTQTLNDDNAYFFIGDSHYRLYFYN